MPPKKRHTDDGWIFIHTDRVPAKTVAVMEVLLQRTYLQEITVRFDTERAGEWCESTGMLQQSEHDEDGAMSRG